jgi:DnaK suppressor protein
LQRFARVRRQYRFDMPKSEQAKPKLRLKQYESILRAKAEDVRRSMAAQRFSQAIARQDCISDEGDLSQKSHEEWLFLNRNTLETKLLREVNQALRRMAEGHYGVCQRCEEPISMKRLDAIPWAKYCVTCQEAIAREPEHEEAVEGAE